MAYTLKGDIQLRPTKFSLRHFRYGKYLISSSSSSCHEVRSVNGLFQHHDCFRVVLFLMEIQIFRFPSQVNSQKVVLSMFLCG